MSNLSNIWLHYCIALQLDVVEKDIRNKSTLKVHCYITV
jgi:hypothetical protein